MRVSGVAAEEEASLLLGPWWCLDEARCRGSRLLAAGVLRSSWSVLGAFSFALEPEVYG